MIQIDIPGWGMLEVEHIVLDLNGTIATDGKIAPEVKQRIHSLSQKVKIHILTADTQGTAVQETQGMNAELIRIHGDNIGQEKFQFLKSLPVERAIAIGNGGNDQLILKEAALGIAVLGDEGMFSAATRHADVIVKNITDALDLLLKPKRLIATLRD